MIRRSLFVLGVVPALLVEVTGRAQERLNGFFLTPPLSLSSGYDDRFIVGSRVLDDRVSLLTSPTLSWMKSTHGLPGGVRNLFPE